MHRDTLLQLINTVDKNLKSISELKALGDLFMAMADLEELKTEDYALADEMYEVCRITQNARYDYKLYLLPKFQDRNKHIDALLSANTK